MQRTYPCGEGAVKWISTDWLEQNYDEKTMMLLDVQPDVHDYFKRHIPGAVYFTEGLLRAPLKSSPAHFLPDDLIQAIFRTIGIKQGMAMVVYTGSGAFKGWGDGLEQTMMAYTLARFGHDSVFVLDGGIDKWAMERRPLTQDYPEVHPSDFKVKVNRDMFIEYDEFCRIKDNDDVLLLDVRPPSFYEGQGPWKKPGHIPGAVNLPWQNLMDAKNKRLLRYDDELRKMVQERGVAPEKTMIVSCGTGREATNVFLLLKYYFAFPKVKIFEGSFTEWVANDGPTVTGSQPRETEMAAKEMHG